MPRYHIAYASTDEQGHNLGFGNADLTRDLPIRSGDDLAEIKRWISKAADAPQVVVLSWCRFEDEVA